MAQHLNMQISPFVSLGKESLFLLCLSSTLTRGNLRQSLASTIILGKQEEERKEQQTSQERIDSCYLVGCCHNRISIKNASRAYIIPRPHYDVLHKWESQIILTWAILILTQINFLLSQSISLAGGWMPTFLWVSALKKVMTYSLSQHVSWSLPVTCHLTSLSLWLASHILLTSPTSPVSIFSPCLEF